MNSFERVLRAFEFRKPDRIPTWWLPWHGTDIWPIPWVTPNDWQPPKGHYPNVHPYLIKTRQWRWKNKPKNVPKDWLNREHYAIDEWGCIWWHLSGGKTMGEVYKGPLNDGWDDLQSKIKFPDLDNPKRYKMHIFAKIFGRRKFRVATLDNFIFERMHFLRGFNNLLMDFRKNPDKVLDLAKFLTPYYEKFIEKWAQYNVHGIFTTDDLGSKTRLFFSIDHFRKFLKPFYKRIVKLCHDLGLKFILHSCGQITKVIKEFIDIGIDGVQIDGPAQVGIERLGELYGGKICFITVVDIQKILPVGTPKDVEENVKLMIKCLGNILKHNEKRIKDMANIR